MRDFLDMHTDYHVHFPCQLIILCPLFPIDEEDTRKAMNQLEVFLAFIDQNIDQTQKISPSEKGLGDVSS